MNEEIYGLNHVLYCYIIIYFIIYRYSDNKLNLHDISSVDKLYDGEGRERTNKLFYVETQ